MLWLTDVHLNFLNAGGSRVFGETLSDMYPNEDTVVITGDIAEAPTVRKLLTDFHEGWGGVTAFVLGNHDYYFGSFAGVKHKLRKLPKGLIWLDHAPALSLGETAALVGHEGWFDGKHGAAGRSRVVMSDFYLIEDLQPHYQKHLWAWPSYREDMLRKLRILGETAARKAKPKLMKALASNETVVFATHFPPYPEAAVHQGKMSDPHWMPWFSCGAMGDMLTRAAEAHPDKKILVLCGHSHSPGRYRHLPNLEVFTGRAKYGKPQVAAVIDLPINFDNIILR